MSKISRLSYGNAWILIIEHPLLTIKVLQNYFSFDNDIKWIMEELGKVHPEYVPKPGKTSPGYLPSKMGFIRHALIYTLVRKYKPELMVETGVLDGVSSYFILKAMEDNGRGRLISIDLPVYDEEGVIMDGRHVREHLPKGKKPGWIVPDKLRARWKMIVGSSSEMLPKIHDPIDCFIHDSEHSYSNMTFELNWALSMMKSKDRPCLLLCDDIGWNNAYEDFLGKNRGKLRQILSHGFGIAEVY